MTMYFAQDDTDVQGVIGQITSCLQSCRTGPDGPLHSFALLDMAFDHNRPRLCLPGAATAVYSTDRWSVLERLGPTLIELSSDNAQAVTAAVGTLARHTSGRPMLSFLVSRADANALVKHWQSCIAPTVAGGEPMLLRFADSRVLAGLPSALSPEHWGRLSGPIRSWWFVSRNGAISELPVAMSELGLNVPSDAAFELDHIELTALLKAGLPDAVIQTMFEQMPDLPPVRCRAKFYLLMRQITELAAKFGVESYPDIYALAVFAAVQSPEVLDSAELTGLLRQRVWRSGELSRSLLELMN